MSRRVTYINQMSEGLQGQLPAHGVGSISRNKTRYNKEKCCDLQATERADTAIAWYSYRGDANCANNVDGMSFDYLQRSPITRNVSLVTMHLILLRAY